jgi:hypothetical protein
MMMNIVEPKLADLICFEVAEAFKCELTWLTTSYGKVEKRERGFGSNKYIERTKRRFYPAVPLDNYKYLELFPNSDLGNFMYMDFKRQYIKDIGSNMLKGTYEIGMVFWFDFTDIYGSDSEIKTKENVKYEVLSAIKNYSWKNLKIKILGFQDRVEDIYNGYFYEELEEQSYMRPYGGFRLNIEVETSTFCI